MPKPRTNYNDTANQLINAVRGQKLDLNKAKTGLGKVINNAKKAKFAYKKMKTLKQIGDQSAKTSTQIIRGAQNMVGTVAGALTADSITKNRSEKSVNDALNKWAVNFGGNPSPDNGANGSSQGGSTTGVGSTDKLGG